MRNIPANTVAAALSPVREIDCRIKIQDDRLLFSEHAPAIAADAFLAMQGDNGYETHGASVVGTGILRIGSKLVNGSLKLIYQWIANPAATWPAWTTTSIILKSNFRPGICADKIWYVIPNGQLYVVTVTNGVLGTPVATNKNSQQMTMWSLAPVSATECFLLEVSELTNKICKVKRLLLTGTSISEQTWPGVFHCDEVDVQTFAAIRDNGSDYIYLSIDNGLRTKCLKTPNAINWSSPQDLIPLDYADDTATMKVGGAVAANNQIFVTGSLVRASGAAPLQFYTMGPDHYTCGRDMFIGPFGTEYTTRTIGASEYFFRPSLGIPLIVSGYLYWICPGYTRRAALPSWLGGTAAQFTYSVNNVSLSHSKDGSSTLSLEVPANIDSSIQPGWTLFLEPLINTPGGPGTWFPMGTYEIDAIITPRSGQGLTKNITARPKGIKRLSQWRADASYDYWSQDARISDPTDRGVNVRVMNFVGDTTSGLVPVDPDKSAFAYSTCRPSTGYISRVKVQIDEGRNVYCGPMVSVFTETSAQAAARLGIEQDAVRDYMVCTSGLAFVYVSDIPGKYYLMWVRSDQTWDEPGIENCPYTILFEMSYSILDPGEYELMLRLNNGYYSAWMRPAGSSVPTWTSIMSGTFVFTSGGAYVIPYNRSDGRGRAGYFARNEASVLETQARTMIMYVSDSSIQLENMDAFNGAEYIALENSFTYNGVTINGLTPRNGTVQASKAALPDGLTSAFQNICHIPPQEIYEASPWDNPEKAFLQTLDVNQWIWAIIGSPAPVLAADALQGCILRLENPVGHGGEVTNVQFEIMYYDYSPPWAWIPNFMSYFNNEERIDPNAFNHVGDTNYGQWSNSYVAIREEGVMCGPDEWFLPEFNYRTYIGSAGGRSKTMIRLWVNGTARGSYSNQEETPGKLHHFFPNFYWSYGTGAPSSVWSRIFSGIRVLPSAALKTGLNVPLRHPLETKYALGLGGTTPSARRWITASAETDMSFAWMAKEICRRAGVLSVDAAQELTSFAHTTAGWNLSEDSTTERERNYAGIVRFQIKTTEVGVMAVDENDTETGRSGTIITVSTNRICMYSVTDGTVTKVEEVMQGSAADTWATVSFNLDRASVWIEDKLAAIFPIATNINNLMLVANAAVTTAVDWPTIDMRIDNFVMDLGQTGIDLVRRLIGQKRIRFLDNSSGGVKFFREGDTINSSGNPYAMVLASNKVISDVNRVTRLRLEGIEVYETNDQDGLLTYGNVFANQNLNELDYLSQFATEGDLLIEDANRSVYPRTYRGAADPRVEPWDHLWINDGDETVEAIVGSVTYNLSISEDQATFDMSIDVEVA